MPGVAVLAPKPMQQAKMMEGDANVLLFLVYTSDRLGSKWFENGSAVCDFLYRILVRVRRPGLAHIIEAEFEYKHHR